MFNLISIKVHIGLLLKCGYVGLEERNVENSQENSAKVRNEEVVRNRKVLKKTKLT